MNNIVKSTCGLCQVGCGILVHVSNGQIIKVEGDPDNPLSKGKLCPKGLAALEYFYHPDRLRYPLKRTGVKGEGRWQRISWDEALATVAAELGKVREGYGAESVAFIRGAAKPGFHEHYFTRFADVFGSPNVAGMAHACAIPRRNASRITCGFEGIPDYEYPPASIIVWGRNASETLYHVHARIMQAVKCGAKLAVVDPNRIKEADVADLWLKPRPGTDLALALGMLNVIINEELYDKIFVERWTVGFNELKAHIRQYTPGMVAGITWVPAEMIKQAARFYACNKPSCIQLGNAIDHGVNSVQTARAICILQAITGNLEIPGGMLRWSPPLLLDASALHLTARIQPKVRQKRIAAPGPMIPLASYALAQGVIKAILSGEPYPVRAAYIQGCNPMLTYSNAQEVCRALKKLDFLVVAEMFMTPPAALADIVLPVASYLEFDSIVAPAYSWAVALIQQKAARLAECRSDYEILRDLARQMNLGEYFWDTEEECLDYILKPSGITFEEFRKIGLLSGTRQYRSYETQGFATPSGKVELYSSQLKEWGFDALPVYYEPPETPFSSPELTKKYPLILTTWKREPYRHSGGRQIVSLRGSHPEPVIMIHPETADELGIKENDWVYIETRRGRIKQKAALTAGLDPRVVCADYCWWYPEKGVSGIYGWADSNVNILTDDEPPFNREMGSPNLRGFLCKVYKVR